MFNETYLDISNRFKTWLQASDTGTYVVNVVKDYLNRAQLWLQLEKQWQGLVVDTTITITSNTADLPSDFISLLALGYSLNNDSFINWYYYRDARGSDGYHVVSTFSKTSGQSYQIKFFTGYPYTPNICRYQKKLEDFEASGTEYSFFPGELLFEVAKYLRIKDYRPDGDDYSISKAEIQYLLKRYKNLEYQNNKMKWVTLDDYGNTIYLNRNNLFGDSIGGITRFNEIGRDTS